MDSLARESGVDVSKGDAIVGEVMNAGIHLHLGHAELDVVLRLRQVSDDGL